MALNNKISIIIASMSLFSTVFYGQVARFDYFKYKGNDIAFEKKIEKANQYYNPVLAGFYPDPSICRKGDTFYLVNSSFSFYPGVPIFTSKDLVNWVQIGHVLDRPSQLNITSQDISMGIFAPTIEYNPHNETFYMITTFAYGIGNFYVKTKDPLKGWSDPILLPDIDGIDPSFFFDADGKGYIVHNAAPQGNADWDQQRAIRLYEFDVEHDRTTGKFKEILRGGSKIERKPIWIEGPHMYKINDYYYLMCAEGGTDTDHSEVVLRSKSPWGPFEDNIKNPILTQRDLPDNRPDRITCAGHADMIQDAQGKWWAVFLASRPYEKNLINTGRETYLLPVKWADGFPEILPQGELIPTVVTKKGLTPSNNPMTGNFEYVENFDSSILDFSWLYLRTPKENFFTIENGKLIVTPLPISIEEKKSPSVILRRQQHTNFEAETRLVFLPKSSADFAGFTLFQNEEFHFIFGITKINGTESLVLNRLEKAKTNLASVALKLANTGSFISLKVVGKGRYYDFLYSYDGQNWNTLFANADAINLSTQHAGGFVGTMIGLYATSAAKD
jgi:xylan 1,4-beta-xylosidase